MLGLLTTDGEFYGDTWFCCPGSLSTLFSAKPSLLHLLTRTSNLFTFLFQLDQGLGFAPPELGNLGGALARDGSLTLVLGEPKPWT